jgi:hypothetical protein
MPCRTKERSWLPATAPWRAQAAGRPGRRQRRASAHLERRGPRRQSRRRAGRDGAGPRARQLGAGRWLGRPDAQARRRAEGGLWRRLTGLCFSLTMPPGDVWQLSAWPWVGSACRSAIHLHALHWALYVPHDVAPTKCTGRPATAKRMQRPARARPHACIKKDFLPAAASTLGGCQRPRPGLPACQSSQAAQAQEHTARRLLQRRNPLTLFTLDPARFHTAGAHTRTRAPVGETSTRPKRALREVACRTQKRKPRQVA